LSNEMLFQVLKLFWVWICSFWALNRLGRPLYVELDIQFPATSSREAFLVWFLKQLPFRDSFITVRIGLLATLDWAYLRGYFFMNLPSYLYLIKALIVVFVGVINLVICCYCIYSYLLITTRFNEYILTPFYACTSAPGYINGVYANCLWYNRTNCNWKCLYRYIALGR
ncbi:hypothetical protein BGZ61DRAFT_375802, partial [Ilyonectria robusta]|uniref:uncharacterized protein n=1 Tax=Ilyonectria robusta TaxID=1079257 RepID=UPI001E8DB2D0